jgi:hypothetical protein
MTHPMVDIDAEELNTLIEARSRAKQIVDELRAQQVKLTAAPPTAPADQLAAGRDALARAIAAAERTLSSLEQALKLAGVELH